MHAHVPRSRPGTVLATSLRELLRLHGPRMLIVEDDRELEPLVRRAVEPLDPRFALDWCTNAEDARSRLAHRYYDLVLADYVLEGERPGIGLRADCWKLQPQAVFAMTSSYPLPEYLHSVGGPGSPFLPKPFDVWGMRRFVASLIPVKEGTRT